MATAPLSANVITKIKARSQSAKFEAVLREVREFRSYCCNINSATIMGVSKEPVIILTLDPNPICQGNAMSWDFTGSYAPGSTITTYSIDFGDTNTDTGSSGTHTYGAAGTFTVSATVTEGTGLTQTITQEVNVKDCSSEFFLLNDAYAALASTGGVQYYDPATEWEDRLTGLTGSALEVHWITINPNTRRLNSTSHELWIATEGGIFTSPNGGRNWIPVNTLLDPSNAEFGDSPAATIDELTFHWIDFDPTDYDTLYALAQKSSVNRFWIYKTTNAGSTWTSRGVVVV